MTNEEFEKIFNEMAKSKASLPLPLLLHILGGIVKSTDENDENFKNFINGLEGAPVKDIVDKTTVVTCNAVIINIWNRFGEEIQKINSEVTEDTEPKA